MNVRSLLVILCSIMIVKGECRAADKSALFAEYNCRTGIVYKTVNGEQLDLALFFPKTKKYEKAPVMVYVHGGAWANHDKTVVFWPAFRETLDILLANGMACASIEYRLNRPNVSTVYDCVVDCKDAARFLVKHAGEYGLDPDRMGTWGGSAGGHLCLMMALTSDDLFPGDPELKGFMPHYRCVASYFPVTSFVVPEVLAGSNFENPNRFIPVLGGPLEEHKDLAKALSPTEYVSPANPPVLLLHGNKDITVSCRSSTYMMDVAKEKGADYTLLTVTNGMHGFGGENIQPSMPEINQMAAKFIMENLTKPNGVKK